ncbi:MAG: PDZ domain-containing protein [Myxococcota bacterium]
MNKWMLTVLLLTAPSLAHAGNRAFLGVELLSVTPELRAHFGGDVDAGILVARVSENGPAAKAGLRVGDLILRMDGKNVIAFGDVLSRVLRRGAGEAIAVDLVREGKPKTFTVTLGERSGGRVIRIGPGAAYWGSGVIDGESLRQQIDEITRSVGSRKARMIRIPREKTADLERRLKTLEEKLRKLENRAGDDT